MSESIYEFRQRYPFSPMQRAILRGADDKVMKEVEIISYPYEDDDGVVKIGIRLTPGDPMTHCTTSFSNLLSIEDATNEGYDKLAGGWIG